MLGGTVVHVRNAHVATMRPRCCVRYRNVLLGRVLGSEPLLWKLWYIGRLRGRNWARPSTVIETLVSSISVGLLRVTGWASWRTLLLPVLIRYTRETAIRTEHRARPIGVLANAAALPARTTGGGVTRGGGVARGWLAAHYMLRLLAQCIMNDTADCAAPSLLCERARLVARGD